MRYALSGVTVTDPVTGNVSYDDGAGTSTIAGPDGVVTTFSPNLSGAVAWNQMPVFIAAGVGVLLGVLGAIAYARRKK